MIHFAHISWVSSMALALPTGPWTAAIGIFFAAVILYLGFRKTYLVYWLCGWAVFVLGREAAHVTFLGKLGVTTLTLSHVSFLLAMALFAASALRYTDSRRYLRWIELLAAAGLVVVILQAIWFPAAPFLSFCYQSAYRSIALLAALRLVMFATGRGEIGSRLFALTLLLLYSDPQGIGASSAGYLYEFSCELLLRLSILTMLLDESQGRGRRLQAMSAITTAAVGVRDYSGMMLTAMTELCRLFGAEYAWFQMVEGDELVLKQYVDLPEFISESRRRVPLKKSIVMPFLVGSETITIKVAILPDELRHDLERAGMNYLVVTPVQGKNALVGILAFGLKGRRYFSAEHRKFISGMANQLGIAGENLNMFDRVLNSKRQWLNTIDSIDDYLLVHDSESRVLCLNRALARRLKRDVTELTGEPLSSVLPNAQDGCPYCELAKRTSGEVSDPCFGGYALIFTSAYVEESGGKTGTVHIICDRTERRTEEERYRLLFESVQEGVFVSTPEGRLVDCNPAFATMLGYESRAEILNVDIGRELFLSSEQREKYSDEMKRQGYLRNYEITLRRKDGRVVTLMENSFASSDSMGEIERYQGFLLDITEKKRIEEDMRRRNRELGALNAMANIATQTFDLDVILRNTLHWVTELFAQHCYILLLDSKDNRAMRIETNHESREQERETLKHLAEGKLAEYLSHSRNELITEEDWPRLPEFAQSWIKQHGYETFIAVVMYSQHKPMGLLFVSSATGTQFSEADRNLATAIGRQLANSVEKVLLYEEATRAYDDLRNTQEQLLQSEKMSAVGQLVSGVAHELNNPLTAILGYVQLLETEPIGERAQDYVGKLYRQTQRTHRVVQNLLSFSRQRKPIQSQVDLHRILEDTLSLRDFDLKLNNVIVEREYDSTVPFITGDAHQLEQVFLNIINNAVDAIMDFAHKGKLKIRSYAKDGMACIEFQDSGPGLKDPSKIFDPFYTTKKIGKGTGLGLSICYGIMKEHGGDIVAFNHEQGGAVFLLKLPIAGREKTPVQADATGSGQA